VFVVVLLDTGSHHPGDADAVAAHDEELLLAGLVQKSGIHGLGILEPQLEDMAHLDPLGEGDRLAALGADIARSHLAQIDKTGEFRIAGEVHVAQMGVGGVGPDDPIRRQGQFPVGI